MQLNVYLLFGGQCEAAFMFYEKTLGAKIGTMQTYGSSPEGSKTPAELRDKIIHGTLTIGDQLVMASDAPPDHYQTPQGFSVSLSVTDPSEAERLFTGLSQNARVIMMPLQETFWAKKFGMLVDQFGIPWLVNCTKEA